MKFFYLTLRNSLLVMLLTLSFFGCSKENQEVKFARLKKEALEFKEAKKFEEARIKLRSAIDIKPKDPESYLELAQVLLALGQAGAALENFQTVINLDPANHEARLALGGILLASKQVELAETHINFLLEKNPQDLDALILKAMVQTSLGKNEEARKILEPLLAANPENTSVISSLAYLNLTDGKIKEAEEMFLKVLKMEPDNSAVRMALGDVYVKSGRLDEAQETIEQLIKSYPEQTSLRYSLGEFLLRRGKGDEAFEQYRQILEKDPSRHEARDRLYDFYLLRKQVDKARQLAADLEKIDGSNPLVNYFKGRNSELDGNSQEALNLYLKTLAATSNFAPAFRRAGLLEIKLGSRREGIEHLNQAISVNPSDVGARIALAQDSFAKHELGQAKQHLLVILQQFPRQVAANILLADIALVEGETEKARKLFNALVELYPESPSGYLKLALLEEREEHPDKAIELYRKVLNFDKNIAVALERYKQLVAKRDGIDAAIKSVKELQEKSKNSKAEYDVALASLVLSTRTPQAMTEARALLNHAIELQPNLLAAYYALARLDGISGDLNSAQKNYEKLVELNPKRVSFIMLLAMTNERLGNLENASDLYRKILTLDPRFGPAANNLAWLIAEKMSGDLDEAIELAKVAKEVMPDEAGVTDTLGWVYFKKGSPRAALPYLEEAVALDKKARGEGKVNPEILYHLGEAQLAVDDKDGARESLQSSLANGGKEFPLRSKVEELLKQLG